MRLILVALTLVLGACAKDKDDLADLSGSCQWNEDPVPWTYSHPQTSGFVKLDSRRCLFANGCVLYQAIELGPFISYPEFLKCAD